ncbi:MAG: DsrE family protein [Pseudomonadota bacterium]|nr:DsrE family protein [Pseudomonadota bacterium]
MKTFPALFALAALALGTLLSPPSAFADEVSDPARLVVGDVRAVYQISGDQWKGDVGEALFYTRKVLDAYARRGVSRDALHIVAVVHGDAGYWLLNDAAYASWEGERARTGATNPNATLVRELIAGGVQVEMCASTMEQKGWKPGDLLPGVKITPGAYPRIVDLQLQGYAHVDFD